MREFKGKLSDELNREIRDAVAALFAKFPSKKLYYGRDYAMDETDMLVVEAVEVKSDLGRFRLAYSIPEARPPFEWEYEITSEYDEKDYFKHYLIRADDIVVAQRKVLLPIDDTEARLILHDITLADMELAQA